MFLKKNSLKKFNTFKLDIKAKKIIIAYKISDIYQAWNLSKYKKFSFLILGNGSNILFLNNYNGIVVINRLKGININEDDKFWYLHVNSGENWHELVVFCLNNGFFGLENLAFIPGTVGAAPIQNIGAYGVELKNFCNYVDVLNCNNNKIFRIKSQKCNFGYRKSIFKNCYIKGLVIIAVGICIKKNWSPQINYFSFNKIIENITPQSIFKYVYEIRKKNIPDYKLFGNAGSFFKNPIISYNKAKIMFNKFTDINIYKISKNKFKISAGWLIEKCNLKGHSIGDAEIYKKHALIIINKNNATSKDILLLSNYVNDCVKNKFNIKLYPEVQFIFSKSIF